MTTEPDDDIVLIDAGFGGLLARLDDAGSIHAADVCLGIPDEVALSTELVSWLLSCDAREVRAAIADGALPAVGNSKKYVTIAALRRVRPITHDDLVAMFERARRRRPRGWMARVEARTPHAGNGTMFEGLQATEREILAREARKVAAR